MDIKKVKSEIQKLYEKKASSINYLNFNSKDFYINKGIVIGFKIVLDMIKELERGEE